MKKRIFLYSILLGILAVGFGLGVYSIVSAVNYRNNGVGFIVNDAYAFFSVEAKYYGNQHYIADNDPTSMYRRKFTQEDYYNGAVASTISWNVGKSEFKYSDSSLESVKKFKFEFEFVNENDARNLSIKLKGVAANANQYFTTYITFQVGENENVTVFNNDPDNMVTTSIYNPILSQDKVDVNTPVVLQSNEKLKVVIIFELNTKTKAFNVDNNLSFEFDSLEK